MQLVATASKEVKWKNIILVLLCAVFTVWFGYDGWFGWPDGNDATVQEIKKASQKDQESGKESLIENLGKADVTKPIQIALREWPGWHKASQLQKEYIGKLMGHPWNLPYKWHTPLDLFWQKAITIGLFLVTFGSIWYYFRCQKRRAIATDSTLSPAEGVEIPWDAITEVDNTKWEKSRIVYLTYKDPAGVARPAVLDEYHLDNLRPILHELAHRAQKANFLPPPESGGSDGPDATATKPNGDAAKPA